MIQYLGKNFVWELAVSVYWDEVQSIENFYRTKK